MNVLSAVFYGILQGLTEFLPVSSSGHLALCQNLLGFGDGYFTFDILLHLSTLAAVCFVYRSDVKELISSFFRLTGKVLHGEFRFSALDSGERMVLSLMIASLPLAAAVFVGDFAEALYANTAAIGFLLIVNGVMLFISDRLPEKKRTFEGIQPRHALTVGVFQLFALLPGLSRSGTTITGCRVCGMKKEDAVKFSFLLSIPTVIGANLFELPDLIGSPVPASDLPAVLLGMAAAAVTGALSIGFLKYLSAKKGFTPFAFYCAALGTAAMIFA